MRWHSLRLRLIAGGIVAILLALTVAGGGLVVLFERHVARTLSADLDIYLKQLIAGIGYDAQGQLVVKRPPADPRFFEPLSGLYWQVSDDLGHRLRSRSLWDTVIALPNDSPAPGQIHRHELRGPAGARLLVAERVVVLTFGTRHIPVRVAAAIDLARVSAATSAFAHDLAIALALLACVLAVATSIQVVLGLRPLDSLRRGIADIRAGRRRHLPSTVPSEVQPLVDEVNALLDAQEQEMERSRSRAADLAHGLKTPLAALAADVVRLRDRGENKIARDLEAVGEAMSRRVDRELVRARLRGGLRRGMAFSTGLAPLVHSLIETLARTPAGQRVTFEEQIGENMDVAFDRTDLAEVLGNLLENAARHATTRVRIVGRSDPARPSIIIEDDGTGISEVHLPTILARGGRLDERGEGAGLGLAIVQDVLDGYGWRLDLAKSELGGLKATIAPAALDVLSPHPSLK